MGLTDLRTFLNQYGDEGTRAILNLSYSDWSMDSQSCKNDVVEPKRWK